MVTITTQLYQSDSFNVQHDICDVDHFKLEFDTELISRIQEICKVVSDHNLNTVILDGEPTYITPIFEGAEVPESDKGDDYDRAFYNGTIRISCGSIQCHWTTKHGELDCEAWLTITHSELEKAYDEFQGEVLTRTVKVNFTATMETDLNCTKKVEVPSHLNVAETLEYLREIGRELDGSEFTVEEHGGDWTFGDAQIVEDDK